MACQNSSEQAIVLMLLAKYFCSDLRHHAMNLLRFILILAAAWIIYTVIRNYLNRKTLQRQKKTASIGTMVRCKYCGLHVPESEAARQGDDYYCSEEHLRLSVRND